ncbi:MogA/MoaB family molybdenum cofactor biosynthesis protein [Lentibacillus saliphilus]|uniref:MogA/MoaB family molybdenum cofactor biosynthesis protein n=1 Tax=Lentibacillus saliphilus TaxID=2737028 RepID=UPI001C30AFA4|nr:molybdenum cofactor biosynthesis protein B [Lentibacillus saliphilus]
MSVAEHKKERQPINCFIITVSDTRTADTDKSGQLMACMLTDAQHHVVHKKIVSDDVSAIRQTMFEACQTSNVDVILLNGGTGIAGRDVTIEAVSPMLDKEMPGFGEIFRMLSYQEDIGSAAILSRALAGIRGHIPIYVTPGSSGAVKLAMHKLILPELNHVVNEATKDNKRD